jgi:hypothetical protein
MDLSALLKPQALRALYLAYSSYKTPNFRPTHRPTDFGRKEPLRLLPPIAFPSRHGNDLHNLDITKSVAHSFRVRLKSFDRDPQIDLGSRSHFGTARDSLLSAPPDWREGVKILGILFSRAGPTCRKSQPVTKSRMCNRDKHSRNKIMRFGREAQRHSPGAWRPAST